VRDCAVLRRRKMPTPTHKTPDVFGIQRDVPRNYVTRVKVDDVFVESLTRNKHIVVYGSSKQGKTSLRKFNLKPDDYISVTCSNTANLGQLRSAILKEAGYTVEQSTTRTVTGESKITAKISAQINVGVAKIGSEIGSDSDQGDSVVITEVALELDPTDVNDIIRALEEIEFAKFIVLEDFHYLPVETQESFAIALKAFHEQSKLTFIIVGVWLDENRLVQYNGDLTGRVLSVDADAWSHEELLEVIASGEKLLNVSLDENFKQGLIEGSFESVYIVQEACYRLCVQSGVYETLETTRTIGGGVDVDNLVRSIVEDQSARYDAFLTNFSSGFQGSKLEMHKWLLLPVLMATSKQLEDGLPWSTVRKVVDANHPSTPVNPGNITQSLGSVASLQVKSKITPIILDYDQTKKCLNVVDRGFLTWLNYQDRPALREDLDLPRDPVTPSGVVLG
jgi:hypothetical protein